MSNAAILGAAAHCYGTTSAQLSPLAGGHFSSVYEFRRGDRPCILRIVPPDEDYSLQAMQAIAAWVDFLAQRGVSVSRPVLSSSGHPVEAVIQDDKTYLVVASEKADGILAETLPQEQWSDTLYRNVGKEVGKMHRAAVEYAPSPALRRPGWDDVGNCFNSRDLLDDSQALVREKRDRLLDYVQTLPKDQASYGMIHADLHLANFFVDLESCAVTLFDFDDCGYGWYMMDTAMLLFDTLVLYAGADVGAFGLSKQAGKQNRAYDHPFAARFMRAYLEGYATERTVDPFWVRQLPHFLKLLEISVYAQLYRGYDPGDPDPWVRKFMPDRKRRIEEDVPYVAFDFDALAQQFT